MDTERQPMMEPPVNNIAAGLRVFIKAPHCERRKAKKMVAERAQDPLIWATQLPDTNH
jgi:hypothetical protein